MNDQDNITSPSKRARFKSVTEAKSKSVISPPLEKPAATYKVMDRGNKSQNKGNFNKTELIKDTLSLASRG
jgi:hypothetical protein